MTLERLPIEVMCRSGHRFDTEDALRHAAKVYGQFCTSARAMEHLARLSISTRQKTAADVKSVLGSSVIGLEDDKYIELRHDNPKPVKLTPLGIIAVNLVHGNLFDEDIDAELREPFLTMPVLAMLPSRVPTGGTIADGDSFHQAFDGLTI